MAAGYCLTSTTFREREREGERERERMVVAVAERQILTKTVIKDMRRETFFLV